MHKSIIPIIEGLALFGCTVFGVLWINEPDGPFEPPFALSGLVLVATEIYRRYRSKDKETSLASLEGKLNQLSVGLDSEKNMRAVTFLSESGTGNEHFKDFLLWYFPNIETAIISIFKSKTFDNFCIDNNITVNVVDDGKERELYMDIKNKKIRGYTLWSGSSLFYGRDKNTFGLYHEKQTVTFSQMALKDFNRLYFLFLGYVNNNLPSDIINNEISPTGMVPPNY